MRKDASRETKPVDLSAGLDEVGMGCLAGPLCVAVVAFPFNTKPISGVTDSKKLTPKKRMSLVPEIIERASYFGIGWAHPQVIDTKGMSEAWRRAACDALRGAPPLALLEIDGVRALRGYPGKQRTYIKGDSSIWQIGAASILAKCMRDLEMVGMSKHYPQYCWEKNMGYGSTAHINALLRLGPTWYHRWSFLKKLYTKHRLDGSDAWRKWEKWRLSEIEVQDDL